jgi:hypothetical protein
MDALYSSDTVNLIRKMAENRIFYTLAGLKQAYILAKFYNEEWKCVFQCILYVY